MIEFRTDPDRRVRYATFRGVIDDRTLVAAYSALFADPGGYDPSFNDLVDLGHVTRFAVTTSGLQYLIDLLARSTPPGLHSLIAVVAPRDDLFGMARMYEQLRADSPKTLRVFRDRAAAGQWLGLPAGG